VITLQLFVSFAGLIYLNLIELSVFYSGSLERRRVILLFFYRYCD